MSNLNDGSDVGAASLTNNITMFGGERNTQTQTTSNPLVEEEKRNTSKFLSSHLH